ncbi:hypothetical protein DSO57_1008590 [Entomophthora muscae]|uniref:Uncharacterized protein n=1 Tax=Entomophthora muscae TaxID=34485 RepID=A0ACC2S915_9FUNG|nr:hypothetical protein DSO57_1008590 [Entomophthora muscae]
MELTFAKTKHEKKISAVFNKLCKFTEAFAGHRLHLVVYLGFYSSSGWARWVRTWTGSFWGSTSVVNNGIHHVSILPLLGHFEDKSLVFAFDSQNELASASGNMIVWLPDSAQLTCPTHACGK